MTSKPQSWKSPQDSCNHLLHTLRESNLHFIVSESPYSVQICVRKKFMNNPTKVKNSVPSYPSLSVKKGFEKRIEDLENEKACLRHTLEKANESINTLKIENEKLQNKIEKGKETFNFHEDKKENVKKFENESAMYKNKAKSLEKCLIAKNKKIQDSKKSLDNARDTIAELKAELSRLDSVKQKLDVGEYAEKDDVKDENENLVESIPEEPESCGKQVTNIYSLALEQMSPVRRRSPSRSTTGTPPSPHTPPGFPSSSSSLEPQSLVLPSLSGYFANPVPDVVHKPISEEYIRNLSKLNLAPRVKRQEET